MQGNSEQDPSLRDELKKTLDDYGRFVVRRRWWLLIPFCLVALVAIGVSLMTPDVYRSDTVILVEHQQVPEYYVVPNVTSELRNRLQTLTQQVLSRTRLLRVIEEFGLYEEQRDTLAPEELVELMRQNIQIELVEDRRRDQVNAFRVAFLAGNPGLAQQVTQRLASLFIEESLKAREQQSVETTDFLQTQLEKAREDLQEQEKRLSQFKSEYLGQLPEQQVGNMQVLTGLQMQLQNAATALNRARENRIYLESLRAQYQSLTEAGGPLPGSARPPTIQMAENELARLRNQRSALLARYTPKHPDVARIDQEIAEAEALLAKLMNEHREAQKEQREEEAVVVGGVQTATAVAQVQSQLKSNQAEIENHLAEEKRLQSEVQKYQQRLNLAPLREQQLADILRNYNLSRTNYEELLKKRMDSELATSLEQRQQGEQFRIIDPPSLPVKPYRPNRARINLVGALLGIGLAAVLAFLADVRDRSLYTQKELNLLVAVPLVVDVPELLTPEEERQRQARRSREWLAASALVLLVLAAEALVYWRG